MATSPFDSWDGGLGEAHDLRGALFSKDGHFHDEHGRTLLLRGVNISGNSKLPTNPPGSTHLKDRFLEHRHVSFVGRPFPLAEADEHFGRLKAWGLTFIRLLVTWESLEHEGPGIYDEEFIDYTIQILEKATEYGIKCFIDPHQDTWSRYSGGSGAPGWTFEVVGLDLRNFMETGAAYVHQSARPADSSHTAWPTNYLKLASATMFTVFFGGEIFAPNAKYLGEHPQEFLQRHFCACYQHLARRLRHLDIVIGFEVMNEPHYGYIGLKSIHHFDPMKDLHLGETPSALQSMALGAGISLDVDVWVKSWPWPTRKSHSRKANAGRISAWLPGHDCIWKEHGVWGLDEAGKPKALISDYFTKNRDGSCVDFGQDCYLPFIRRYTTAIHAVKPDYFIFFEPIPNENPPEFAQKEADPYLVYSPHWYDLKALFSKSFNGVITHDVQGLSRGTKNVLNATYFGVTGANRNYYGQIKNIVHDGRKLVGANKPIVFGECGIPMDMNEKKAFETGDYSHHTNFLDAMINALEGSLVNFTLWNYNPHNDNIWGDHWNGEDFSIYSPSPTPPISRSASRVGMQSPLSQSESSNEGPSNTEGDAPTLRVEPPSLLDCPIADTDSENAGDEEILPSNPPPTPFDITDMCYKDEDTPNSNDLHYIGGRALDAVIRPYVAKLAGEPLVMRFVMERLEFYLDFVSHVNASIMEIPRTTEIFVPLYHYGAMKELDVQVSDGVWSYNPQRQTLYWRYDPDYRTSNEGTFFASWLTYLTGRSGGTETSPSDWVKHSISIKPTPESRPPTRSRSIMGTLWHWTRSIVIG
ncbi:glycoside hydrolase superfamily [Phlyctochytrium arcticum]|nr:glycoside hydrolase superfamily [Phlyctochytrium arcticum]